MSYLQKKAKYTSKKEYIMQINSVEKTTFGQIFISPNAKEQVKKLYKATPQEKLPDKDTFNRNWEKCLNTTEFDILIQNNGKVFLLDKTGQRVMEEKISRNIIWNIDTALKRVLMYEDSAANNTQDPKILKYDA